MAVYLYILEKGTLPNPVPISFGPPSDIYLQIVGTIYPIAINKFKGQFLNLIQIFYSMFYVKFYKMHIHDICQKVYTTTFFGAKFYTQMMGKLQ